MIETTVKLFALPVAVAGVVLAPVKVIGGAVLKPEPAAATVTETTVKPVVLPVPVGLVPATRTVPPLKAIVGAVVKPVPGLPIVMLVTKPPTRFAVAVAPEPPPPVMAMVGATL